MCKRCRCAHKLVINVLRIFIQFLSALVPITHARIPEKKRLILYTEEIIYLYFVTYL